jgi:hypothetical protein
MAEACDIQEFRAQMRLRRAIQKHRARYLAAAKVLGMLLAATVAAAATPFRVGHHEEAAPTLNDSRFTSLETSIRAIADDQKEMRTDIRELRTKLLKND